MQFTTDLKVENFMTEFTICYLNDEGLLITDAADEQDKKMTEIFLKYNPGLPFIR